MTATITEVLGRFVAESVVPPEAAEATRVAVADCLGCTIAGASEDAARIVREALLDEERAHGATILGAGRRGSEREAALANGTAAHALDYDDINWTMYGHPSVAILPAAFAVAESTGATLGALFDGYAVGVEVAAKIGHWANPKLYMNGWHATGVIGALGASAAVARILRLSPEAAGRAIAIAASESAGVRRNFGTMVKPLHAGRAAEAGVVAARLAERGFTANNEAIEGRFGFFETFGGREVPDPAELAEVLGAPWDVVSPGIVLKRYPSCGATHCALDAVLSLKAAHGFGHDDIEWLRCGAESLATRVLQYPRPETGLEGKFSMHFCLAAAVVDGAPRLRHFSKEWIADPRVRDLISRIEVIDRADLGGARNDAVPAEVEVCLKDGRRFAETVSVPSGDPRRPMTEDQKQAKFRECAQLLGEDCADAAWQALTAAPRNAEVSGIATLLSGRAALAPV